jgi:hypothetical protein
VLTLSQLESLLSSSEGGLIERKEGMPNARELRKTLVAFANSVLEGQLAIIFLGIKDTGEICGVDKIDGAQKNIRDVADKECYPPIKLSMVTVPSNGKEVLAVIIPPSRERPHFAGHSFVRRGSECVSASREMLDEMIATRNDKTRRIAEFKDKKVILRLKSKSGFFYDLECLVRSCDAHSVTLGDNEGVQHTFSLSGIEIQRGAICELEIIASPIGTEEEHVRAIIFRWARFRMPPLLPVEYHLPHDYLIGQIVANPTLTLPAVSAMADGTTNQWLKLLRAHVRFELKKMQNPQTRQRKIKSLEIEFHRRMKGAFPLSNADVIAAVVHSVLEVATSMKEVEEFVALLLKQNPGAAKVEFRTFWNALSWELGLT